MSAFVTEVRRTFPWLLLAAIAAPAPAVPVLSGIPFSSWPKFAALVALLPLVASPRLRHRVQEALASIPAALQSLVVLAPALALVLKGGLYAMGPHSSGFEGCYVAMSSPGATACELSFERPFSRGTVTRLDPTLMFGPDDWSLGFVNSLRFNYYPWESGQILRDRLPFAASWSAAIEAPPGSRLQVEYIGAVTVWVDRGAPLVGTPSYERAQTLDVDLGGWAQRIRVLYRFDDGYRTGQAPPPGPRPRLAVWRVGDAGQKVPLTAAGPGQPAGAAGVLVDLLLLLSLLAVTASYLRGWTGDLPRIACVLVLLAISMRLTHPWAPPHAVRFFAALLLLAWAVARPTAERLSWIFGAVVIANVIRISPLLPSHRWVNYRSAGDDWLTYESFTRTILETWSLEGAEPVFYLQPFYRYIRFAQRLLLGDGELFPVLLSLSLLAFGAILVSAMSRPARWPARLGVLALGAAALAMAWSPEVYGFVLTGLSEHPTWVALPFVLYGLFQAETPRSHRLGVVLLACSVITRMNHLPASVVLLGVFLWARRHDAPGARWRHAAVFLAILCLPLLHNLVYGGQAVFSTTSAGIAQNLEIGPGTYVRALGDGEARSQVLARVRDLLVIREVSPTYAFGVRLTQLGWLVAGFLIVWQRRSLQPWLIHGIPLCYLGIHLVYQVAVYYPRHVTIGYLSAALVSLLAVAGPQRDRARPDDAPPASLG
ncbi:hypothetical protein [Luteitalea sp.]